jgi:hypothetical protein
MTIQLLYLIALLLLPVHNSYSLSGENINPVLRGFGIPKRFKKEAIPVKPDPEAGMKPGIGSRKCGTTGYAFLSP